MELVQLGPSLNGVRVSAEVVVKHARREAGGCVGSHTLLGTMRSHPGGSILGASAACEICLPASLPPFSSALHTAKTLSLGKDRGLNSPGGKWEDHKQIIDK